MNSIHNIFTETNLDEIPIQFWDETKPLCWYPSSGYDFRHIFFWDNLRQSDNLKFPKIFIHTDFTCLDYNPYPKEHMDAMSRIFHEKDEKEGKPTRHPLLSNGYILDVFGSENKLIIKKWNELFLKEDVFYPNKDLFHFADQVGERTHKVFAIQCQLISIGRDFYPLPSSGKIETLNGGADEIVELDKLNLKIVTKDEKHKTNLSPFNFEKDDNEILILLFTMENSNFFYDVILRNKIKIDYLTHINDGGASMGGSRTKMDFIYLYSETLALTNMIIDYTLEEKEGHLKEWMHQYYHNPKVRGEPIFRKELEINIKEWKGQKIYFPNSKGIYIKSKNNTGNRRWQYSFFKNEPINEFPNEPNQYRQYEEYNFYSKS